MFAHFFHFSSVQKWYFDINLNTYENLIFIRENSPVKELIHNIFVCLHHTLDQ